MAKQSWMQVWGQIVAKSWDDDSLKKRLMSEPAAVLKEHGLDVPPGVQIKVVQNTDSLVHLPMAPKPASTELSEEDLANVAGGVSKSNPSCNTCSLTYFS